MIEISIIVPLFNSKDVVEDCLDSVLFAMGEVDDADLIVIDNGSNDGSYELVQGRYGHVAKIQQRRKGTIASLRNFGAQLAQGEYLFFLDSDCVISKTYLQDVKRVFREVTTDASGSKCEIPASPSWCEETWQRLHRRTRDGYINYINSGNFVIKRSAFNQVGGFDERLETDEDVDLGERLRAVGFKIYESHDLKAIHLRNAKTLQDFFKKEVWRGLGMARSHRRLFHDKVLMTTLAHIAFNLIGISCVALLPVPLAGRAALMAACSLFAPVVSVAYRYAALRRFYRPIGSVILYHLWLDAKIFSLLFRVCGAR